MPATFFYPTVPPPSNTHAPVWLDPSHRFDTDQGVSMRRSRWSRPRRVWQLDYLGLMTAHLREFQDFLLLHRLDVTPFQWRNDSAADLATISNTTPVILTMAHTYITGQWVAVTSATVGAGLVNNWQITRLSLSTFALNGSTAQGTGTCSVLPYVPYALGHFPDGRWEAPVKLIGPDSVFVNRARWNMTVFIEELF